MGDNTGSDDCTRLYLHIQNGSFLSFHQTGENSLWGLGSWLGHHFDLLGCGPSGFNKFDVGRGIDVVLLLDAGDGSTNFCDFGADLLYWGGSGDHLSELVGSCGVDLILDVCRYR